MTAIAYHTRWGCTATLLFVSLLVLYPLGCRADEKPKAAAEEGKAKRDGDGDGGARKPGARDGEGEGAKKGARDGDGEGAKKGQRDGDKPRTGPRDGDKPKTGAREGEGGAGKSAEGDSGAGKSAESGSRKASTEGKEGERMGKDDTSAAAAVAATTMVIQVNAVGDVINSRGEVIAVNQVRGRMASIATRNPNQPVILRCDPAATEEQRRKVQDALRDVGLRDVKTEAMTK